jgi:hypothetical protein
LLSSCHLLGVLSPAHLRSAYCDLEIQCFLNIVGENPSRGIVLILNELNAEDVPTILVPYLCVNQWSEIQSRLSRLIESSRLRLGGGPYEPSELFEQLPLSSDEWLFGFGPTQSRRRIFELYVREYMVLILKGADPTQAKLYWPMGVSDVYKSEALIEARNLVAEGISPYPQRSESKGKFLIAGSTGGKFSQCAKLEDAAPNSTEQPVHGARTCSASGAWYELVDYGGQGYPQDMDFVCRACGHREGITNPNDAPDACPRCGRAE